ncbi:MAG: SurA N-terminal domain-containing protein [Bdellovibrionales bacterium]|nr:SurA N-terminal domain-containing protein [Bdellovibrionales bacterium]
MRFILLFIVLWSSISQAKLLDKITVIVDDKAFTESQIQRVLTTLKTRKEISPQIYNEDLKRSEIVNIFINRILIKEKLKEMGYIIGDDQVEAQIGQTEKRLRLNRATFIEFLSRNNLKFDEYFEIIRETIEYNVFISRIIQPMISITEQEIKNSFFKTHSKDKTFTFKYNLVDFSIPKSSINREDLNSFQEIMEKYQQSGVLPPQFSSVQTNVLGEVTEEFINKDLIEALKVTEEGKFSRPILIGKEYHVFFVKKKDLMESELFNRGKNKIRAELFNQKSKDMKKVWFQREENKHFIKKFL